MNQKTVKKLRRYLKEKGLPKEAWRTLKKEFKELRKT